jgi:hypothetical protein
MAAAIYIGDTFAVVHGGQRSELLRFERLNRAVLDTCFATVGQSRGWSWSQGVDVVVSSSIARPFLMQPVAGLKTFAEAVSLAVAHAPSATGLMGELDVQLEALPLNTSALATAAPRLVLQEVRAAAIAARLKVSSLRPLWACAIGVLRKQAPLANAIMVVEEDAATLVMEADGGYVTAQTFAPKPSPDAIQSVARRASLSNSKSQGAVEVASVDLDQWSLPNLGLCWATK